MRIAPPIIRALRLSIFEGSMFGIYWSIVAGIIMNGLAIALGATPLHMSILNALPLLSQVFGVIAAKLIQERDIRKPLVLAVEGVSRFVWIFVPCILLLPDDPKIRVNFILLVAAISHIAHSGGVVGWVSWVSDLVPEEIRGVYFGVRSAVIGLITVLGTSFASRWADSVKKEFPDGPEYINTLLILVGVSLFFSTLSWIGLYYQPVRKMKKMVNTGWNAIWDTLKTSNGKRIAISWVSFAFATGITMGVFIVFFLDRLNMSLFGVTVYSWIALVVSTAITPLMGRISDRFGHKTLLIIAWAGVFWQPLLSVFTPNDMPHIWGLMPWTILVDAFAGGCFWPAVGVAQNNIVIGSAPSETRAGLFAVLSALAGIAGFVGAVLGGMIAGWIGPGNEIMVVGITVDDVRAPMLLGCALRFLAGITIFYIREPERHKDQITSQTAFTVVWKMLTGKPIRVVDR